VQGFIDVIAPLDLLELLANGDCLSHLGGFENFIHDPYAGENY
jgi:hypothetical protein